MFYFIKVKTGAGLEQHRDFRHRNRALGTLELWFPSQIPEGGLLFQSLRFRNTNFMLHGVVQ